MVKIAEDKVQAIEQALDQLQQRVEELETRLSFQDDAQQQLDKVIAGQDAQLLKQQQQIQLLAEKLKSLESRQDAGAAAPVDERPPHY